MEHLLEYQDYLLAYRLRSLIGGPIGPRGPLLALPDYARRRLERQQLARELLGSGEYRQRMKRVDALTDELNFGFWHNPNESVIVMKRVIEAGGCRALETEEAFVADLLTPSERGRLGLDRQRLVARYYLGLLRASAAYLDAEVFTRLRAEVEPLRATMPLFALGGTGDDRRPVPIPE